VGVTKGVVLDTAVLIGAERGTFDMAGYLATLGDAPVALAAISASELLHGVERARDPAVRGARSAFVEGVLANIPVIPFALDEARVHARIWAALAAAGTLVGPHDLQVAATALAAGSAVATLNRGEFGRVPGLELAATAPFVRA
jgi:tRNA(fMet)-specific endonuclease VapC